MEPNTIDTNIFKTIYNKDISPLNIGQSRASIREEALLEASYVKGGEEMLESNRNEQERAKGKGLIHMFGYKHSKALKFYGNLLRCLRDCYDMKFE